MMKYQIFQKMDIFKELLWYAYKDSNADWVAVSLQDVEKIMALNAKGKKPDALEVFTVSENETPEPAYENVVGQDEVTRFDNKNRKRKKRKPRKGKPRKNRNHGKNKKQ